jgi:hypothetical protein
VFVESICEEVVDRGLSRDLGIGESIEKDRFDERRSCCVMMGHGWGLGGGRSVVSLFSRCRRSRRRFGRRFGQDWLLTVESSGSWATKNSGGLSEAIEKHQTARPSIWFTFRTSLKMIG